MLPVYARGGGGGRIPNLTRSTAVPWEDSAGPAGKVFRAVTFARIRMGSSFEDLYRRHVQAVFRFALRVTGDRATAEDVTSEAFLALYRNLDSIDESLLPGWLLTAARNRARDLWRRRAVEQRYLEQLDQPREEPAVDGIVAAREPPI